MKRIAVFASGSGTNFQSVVDHFRKHDSIEVSLLLCNRADAYVIERAERENIPAVVFTRKEFYETDKITGILRKNKIDFIALAGFLWLLPPGLISEFEGRIVNVHPALLPKYGGKGMYGDKVHRSVLESGEKISGITIHCVNEEYDKGSIIFQATCEVLPGDTVETLSARIKELEHKYYPEVIEKLMAEI